MVGDFVDRVVKKLAVLSTPRVQILRVTVSEAANKELFKVFPEGEKKEQKYFKKITGYDVEVDPAMDECVAIIVYISRAEGGMLRSTFVI